MTKTLDEKRIDFACRSKAYTAFARWYAEGRLRGAPGIELLTKLLDYSEPEHFKANMNERDRILCMQLGGQYGWAIYKMLSIKHDI